LGTIRTLKVVIAVALLLCLLPLPYGYYELVRWGGMVCFCVLAFNSYKQKQEGWMVAYAALAVLFQPFCKIALGRSVWNAIDVAVAGLLMWTVWKKRR
jgi:hypothetical protein